MAYRSLKQFIEVLESEGELIRIQEFVDPKLEITEITDRISKAGLDRNKALLFENTGTGFPVLMNAMGSERRMALALGVNELDDVAHEIEDLFKMLAGPKEGLVDKLKMLPQLGKISSWMPKVVSRKGECQQVVMDKPDMTKLPVLTCWPEDGGPFLTLPIINTLDPNTGIRNVGLYRMQVFGPELTGMHWHKHKVSAGHFNEYKKLGRRMPVAVALGGDPAYAYSATAPLPPNIDEYMLAGFLRKKRVELVKCLTQDIHVPADADIIIEGYVDPDEDLIWEGPFGDHTGYYSLADWYPRFHVTAITHKKDAIYPATIVGIPPQEDAWIGKATERIFLAPIKMTMVPEIVDMELPIEGVFHNLTIVKIEKEYAGQALKVMNAMWGAGQMMFNKILVMVDGDVDIHNYLELSKVLSQHVDPETDLYFSQGPMDVLDHSCTKFAFGGKLCIDATQKHPEELRTEVVIPHDPASVTIDKATLMADHPEITSVNTELLKMGLSVVFVAMKKDRPHHVKELNQALFERPEFEWVKAIFYVENRVNAEDVEHVIFRFTNNLDPKRDKHLIEAKDDQSYSHIGLDGTRKTKKYDNFQRDWPNLVSSDAATIASIDEKWNKLGLGSMVESPSLKYQGMIYPGGAIAAED